MQFFFQDFQTNKICDECSRNKKKTYMHITSVLFSIIFSPRFLLFKFRLKGSVCPRKFTIIYKILNISKNIKKIFTINILITLNVSKLQSCIYNIKDFWYKILNELFEFSLSLFLSTADNIGCVIALCKESVMIICFNNYSN